MLYGLMMMGLAMYKAAQLWKESAAALGRGGLVKVLILDQAGYFLW